MSILKRKTFSLDPVQKLKKTRQIEYFMLIDKCLQIPNDDKLILRKNVLVGDDFLICLLQKQRKQGSKDLRELQIHLRKFIQKYKADNPKYPTLKIGKGSESSLSLNKRSSFSFSVSQSKFSHNLPNSNIEKISQTSQNKSIGQKKQLNLSKSKLITPLKSQRQNYFGIFPKKFQKTSKQQTLKLNTSYCREDEKNYEELIKQRKTQKLKIEGNRVSVTIENQSLLGLDMLHSQIQPKGFLEYKIQTQNTFLNQSFMNVNDSLNTSKKTLKQNEKLDKYKKDEFIPSNIKQYQNKQKSEKSGLKIEQSFDNVDLLLSTMNFKMKIDEPQEEPLSYQSKIQSRKSSIKSTLFEEQNDIIVKQSLINHQQKNQIQVKRKLFDSINSHYVQQLMPEKLKQIASQPKSYPLNEIDNQSKFLFIDNGRKEEKNMIKQQLNEPKLSQENFNSGEKFSISNTPLHIKSFNQSIVQSQVKSINQDISRLSTINKQNQYFNESPFQYTKTHNEISNKKFLEDSRAFVKSIIKQRDQKSLKQSKSSRMQFSHRMEEIISGRTQKHQPQTAHSFSNRDKIRGANKLAFWARIQSTINS